MADPSTTSAPYVFLSYASAEQDRALAVADALQQAGIPIWLDRHAIAGGSAWSTEIVRGIRNCAAFIVLGSERAFRSPNVQRELNLAVEENRPVLPLLLEQVTAPDDVRYALAGRQWVPLLDRAAEVWLTDVLRALAGLGIVAATAAEAATAPSTVSPPTNLPASLTSFLGREQELDDLAQLLANNRVVTLTGPGGTGKTRLALQTASAQAAAFPDGVFFVDLAPLQDPTLVPSAVAQALGVQGLPEIPLRESVLRFLREKRMLLVLDNYEHLLAAAEFAGALLQAGPALTLLVTSRAPLRVRGEREYPVAPLPLPLEELGTAAAAENPAVALFVLRARDVRPEFVLTDANVVTVAAICTRLDGLPLAIELAAARVRVLQPAALLARLEQRLPLLAGGLRDVPARQRSLRDTIAWSTALLETAEQTLFRRLAVFAGGCTLEAAGAVCDLAGDLGSDVFEGMGSLVEKSLLRETEGPGGESRFGMLETIREFALDQLRACGEEPALRTRHVQFFLQFADQADRAFRGEAHSLWLQRLMVEHDNVRAALAWSQVEPTQHDAGLRLAGLLVEFWLDAGLASEGRRWLSALLARDETAATLSRAHAHYAAGCLDFNLGDYDQAEQQLRAAVPLFRDQNEALGLARTLHILGHVGYSRGGLEYAATQFAECLELFRDLDDTYMASTLLGDLGCVSRDREEYDRASGFLTEALRLARQLGDNDAISHALRELATVVMLQGEHDLAATLCNEALALTREYGDKRGIVGVLNNLGRLAHLQGEEARAVALYRESLQEALEIGDKLSSVEAIEGVATSLFLLPHAEHTTRLFGAAAALRKELGAALPPAAGAERGHILSGLRAALGAEAFGAADAAGRSLTLAEAASETLAGPEP